MYHFLAVEVAVYLPAHECVTIYFLKDIVAGKKKCKYIIVALMFLIDIKNSNVRFISIPQYDGLTIEELLNIRNQYPDIDNYMPEERDFARLPRQWIANVMYTIVGDEFRNWVTNKIRERNDRLAEKHDLMIDMDPEIARAF